VTAGGSFSIGCGSAYANDRIGPAIALAASGRVQALAFDCLAERTLALAQLRKRVDPTAGYDERLPQIVSELAQYVAGGLTVIGNFGAANVPAAVELTLKGLREHGAPSARVGMIEGDDVLAAVRVLDPVIEELDCTVSQLGDRVVSANAYLGAEPIVIALADGADWVIGGRIGDASLYVGPICAALGWDLTDCERVATATVVGHILECGTQCTGGYFADPPYRVVPELWRLGFPYAIVSDADAVITKLPGTGGLVNELTVSAQLAYEVHDPTAYVTPDVTANFAGVHCDQAGPDRVRVTGAHGTPASDLVKVMIGVERGYHAVGEVSYAGAGCVGRADLAADVIAHNVEDLGDEVEDVRYDKIGIDALVGSRSAAASSREPSEVRLRVSARTRTRAGAHALTLDVERLVVHGPAGGGGPTRSVTQALSVHGVLIPKHYVTPRVTVTDVSA
jgi:hypothetical protein